MASKPKPALSVWLISQRKALNETVEDTARVVDRSAATIRGWEAGRPPSADDPSIVVLERHYGSEAPRETAGDQSAMVAAIDRQTLAIDRQTAMLERVLMALGASPSDSLEPEAHAAIAGAEIQLAQERAESTSPPRRRGRVRRASDRAASSPEAGSAG